MYKRFKFAKTVSAIILISLIFSGCFVSKDPDDYHGEYPELYSVAIHSLLGTTGCDFSERKFDSEIMIVEEDQYGRTMFLYYEGAAISTWSFLVSQKSDDNYSYFYPDFNFTSFTEDDLFLAKFDFMELYNQSDEEIEALKSKNDWDMKIDLDKCVKVEIVRKKAEGPVQGSAWELYNKALGDDAHVPHSIEFFTTDDYGRSIYFGYGKPSSERYIVMLFKPDGTYDESKCVMELTDLYSYQDELKQFKDLNDWNKPI